MDITELNYFIRIIVFWKNQNYWTQWSKNRVIEFSNSIFAKNVIPHFWNCQFWNSSNIRLPRKRNERNFIFFRFATLESSLIRINISHNIRISLHQHIFNINWAQSLFTRVFRPYKRRLISVRHESKIIRSDLIVSFTTIRIYNLS